MKMKKLKLKLSKKSKRVVLPRVCLFVAADLSYLNVVIKKSL
jgi:hypothetical protein